MPNELKTIKVSESGHKSVFRFMNASDGTAESAVTKIDISTLPGAPSKVKITSIEWSVKDMAVRIYFDHTTDDLVAVLTGEGSSGLVIEDPASAGGTGDILISTHGAVAGSSYQVDLEVQTVA